MMSTSPLIHSSVRLATVPRIVSTDILADLKGTDHNDVDRRKPSYGSQPSDTLPSRSLRFFGWHVPTGPCGAPHRESARGT